MARPCRWHSPPQEEDWFAPQCSQWGREVQGAALGVFGHGYRVVGPALMRIHRVGSLLEGTAVSNHGPRQEVTEAVAMAGVQGRTPWWAWAWPPLALAVLASPVLVGLPDPLAVLAGAALIAAVFAAVYHAEVVAHRVGEPFGTLLLALAVTVIEAALIVSIILGGGDDQSGLARDTVFAAVMIVCNGIVGLCLLSGGVRHHEQGFQVHGASAALAVLAALTLILP